MVGDQVVVHFRNCIVWNDIAQKSSRDFRLLAAVCLQLATESEPNKYALIFSTSIALLWGLCVTPMCYESSYLVFIHSA